MSQKKTVFERLEEKMIELQQNVEEKLANLLTSIENLKEEIPRSIGQNLMSFTDMIGSKFEELEEAIKGISIPGGQAEGLPALGNVQNDLKSIKDGLSNLQSAIKNIKVEMPSSKVSPPVAPPKTPIPKTKTPPVKTPAPKSVPKPASKSRASPLVSQRLLRRLPQKVQSQMLLNY